MTSLREIKLEDFNKLSVRQRNASYHRLHSVLGYSRTEFSIEQETQPFREYVFDDIHGDLLGAIRLSHTNLISQNMRIQLLVISRTENTICDISTALRQLIEQVKNYENINRFYSFIFGHEGAEQQILIDAHFQQEATLARHTYISGKYNDVLIFGTERI